MLLCGRYTPIKAACSFDQADSLFSAHYYKEAALAYEHIIFSCPKGENVPNALLKKAKSYKHIGMHDLAYKTLKRVNFRRLVDSLHFPVRYEMALNAYLSGDFASAEAEVLILKNENIKEDYFDHSKTDILYVLILNEQQKWAKAKEELLKSVETNILLQPQKDSILDIVMRLYSKKNIPHLKNPNVAYWLSFFMPGTGQLYTGNTLDGIINVSILIAAGTFTVVSVLNGYYMSAFGFGSGIFQAFYTGGLTRVEYLAEQKNYNLTKDFNNRLKSELITLFD